MATATEYARVLAATHDAAGIATTLCLIQSTRAFVPDKRRRDLEWALRHLKSTTRATCTAAPATVADLWRFVRDWFRQQVVDADSADVDPPAVHIMPAMLECLGVGDGVLTGAVADCFAELDRHGDAVTLPLLRPSVDAYLSLLESLQSIEGDLQQEDSAVGAMAKLVGERLVEMANGHAQPRKVFERACASLSCLMSARLSAALCRALLFHADNLPGFDAALAALCDPASASSASIGYQRLLISAVSAVPEPERHLPDLMRLFVAAGRANVPTGNWFGRRRVEFLFFRALLLATDSDGADLNLELLAELLRVVCECDILSSANDALYGEQLAFLQSLVPHALKSQRCIYWLIKIDLRTVTSNEESGDSSLMQLWSVIGGSEDCMRAALDGVVASGRLVDFLGQLLSQRHLKNVVECPGIANTQLLQRLSDAFHQLTSAQKLNVIDLVHGREQQHKRSVKSVRGLLRALFLHRIYADDQGALLHNSATGDMVESPPKRVKKGDDNDDEPLAATFLKRWFKNESERALLVQQLTDQVAAGVSSALALTECLHLFEVVPGDEFLLVSIQHAIASGVGGSDPAVTGRLLTFWSRFLCKTQAPKFCRQVIDGLMMACRANMATMLAASSRSLVEPFLIQCQQQEKLLLEIRDHVMSQASSDILPDWFCFLLAKLPESIVDGCPRLTMRILQARVAQHDQKATSKAENILLKEPQMHPALWESYLKSVAAPPAAVANALITAISGTENNDQLLHVMCRHYEKIRPHYSLDGAVELAADSDSTLRLLLQHLSLASRQQLWASNSLRLRQVLLQLGYEPPLNELLSTLDICCNKGLQFDATNVLLRTISKQKLSHGHLLQLTTLSMQTSTDISQQCLLLATLMKFQPGCRALLPLFIAALMGVMERLRLPAATENAEVVASQATSVSRLVSALTAHRYKSAVKKHAIVVLCSYITALHSERPFIPAARPGLTECAYLLLDTCGDHEKDAVAVRLSTVGKALFRSLYGNYVKFHKFSGKI